MASYYIESSLKFLFFVLLTLMLSFPKSFAVIKMVILASMFAMVFLHIVLGGVRRFSLDIIFFYLVFILLAVVWLIIGLLNDGYAIALSDAFRLYVVFSLIFLIRRRQKLSATPDLSGTVLPYVLFRTQR